MRLAWLVIICWLAVGCGSKVGGPTVGVRDGPAGSRSLTERPSPAQLVAGNYKPLTPKQSRRLLRYADRIHACLAGSVAIDKPKPSKTQIVMALGGSVAPAEVAQLGAACGRRIGDPPPDSSLQIRGTKVILYMPKYCILDDNIVRQHEVVAERVGR
jgi:hypothetical protein